MSAVTQPSSGTRGAGETWSNPAAALERRTVLVERAVAEAYERHLAPRAPEGLALLAVGGFGRRELFPHSDVDLLLLTEKPAIAERERASILGFLQALWDGGLRVSHSVRTPAECRELYEENIELSISLLDERLLAGDGGLHAKLVPGLARFFHGQRQALARHLCRRARERHHKYGGSIYQLEPDVKEGPGGLRDLQLLAWLERLRQAQPERLPRREGFAELLPARDFLWAVRIFLHDRTGRDSNTLTFDLQDEAAERFSREPADWMRDYYASAREIHRACARAIDAAEEQASSLLVGFREWRSRVSNAEFYVARERVYFRAPQGLEQDPTLSLRLFEFAGRHGMRLALETERRLAQVLPVLRRYFAAPPSPLWPALRELLAMPHCALALRAMQETGVLGALFPEWEPIECLVIRDFHHRYTVDEHTLRAIETLDELGTAREPSLERFSELIAEIDDPELLRFALLFHDLGKAAPLGRHVPESLRLARGALERIGMPEEQRRTVAALVERHLELSKAMSSRDPDDPATARYLAECAGTLEILKRLTLLTCADISAVNPTALSSWRREQLWRVYLIAYNELTRELETERIRQAPLAGVPGAAEFLEGFPVRYLHTHSEPEIAAHFELAQSSRDRGVALDIRKENGYYRMTIVAPDRPFLLASIAGALAGFGMNIVKAEGFANRQGTILDTFVFTDPHRALELNPTEVDRLRLTLERVALGRLEVKELLRQRPVPAPPSRRACFPPVVSFDPAASESATLIEVVAQDRPGLLYTLASAISSAGANIELVLIDTEGHKAIDVFYVTEGGKKLGAAQQAELKEKLLAACGA